jgi:hypothetical protein
MTVSVQDTAPKFYNIALTIDGLDVAATVTRMQFTPDEPDLRVKTLAGPRSNAATASWTVELEGLQDWFEAQNLVTFLSEHVGEEATLTATWTGANGETSARSATVVCKSVPWGGTADELATFSITLPVNGTPTPTDSAGS